MELSEEQCNCSHSWDEHEKPPGKIPWDICSFPCLKCNCDDFEGVEITIRDGKEHAGVTDNRK
jgi:hypothetical protein